MLKIAIVLISITFFISCSNSGEQETYETQVNLIKQHTTIFELITENEQSRIAVVPEFQGRIATSTNSGLSGKSLGWITPGILQSGNKLNGSEIHGEERVWIGPQGSQFSFYYGRQHPINEDNWDVPKSFNAEPFQFVSRSEKSVQLSKNIQLTNYIGTRLNMKLEREISVLEPAEIEKIVGTEIPENTKVVAYISSHKLSNTDSLKWEKETGLASIWSLSTFKGTDKTITFIPLRKPVRRVQILQYLNTFKEDRFCVQNNIAWYKTDGKYRSKIGIPPELSKGIFGCYQPENNTLRIIYFHQNNKDSLYFNSNVTVQKDPYRGEAIAVYNNGPMDLSEGSKNSFFEMESAAAMKELTPGEYLQHFHSVFQFTGSFEKLNLISKAFLGVDISESPFRD